MSSFNNNNNMNGEILQDLNKNKKERPFREKKLKSLKLAKSFYRIYMDKKALNVKLCGYQLGFKECLKDGYKKLYSANFCKDRLCPMCAWRRSKMLQGQVLKIIHKATEQKKMKFIFLTLTIKNCTAEDLKATIDKLFKAYKLMFKYKDIDKIAIGWLRCLEVTYNKKNNTYHPHFHVLIGVNPSYFKNKEYIKQVQWVEYWRKALKIDYDPVVSIEVVKAKRENQTIEGAVAETAKYTVKDSDYILDDKKQMDKVVLTLSMGLHGRRLISYGKLFRKVKLELNLKDIESKNADLIGEVSKSCQCPICSSNLIDMLYKWDMTASNYIGVEGV
jgi:plasmid rolling circle replication initiator protein Rep